MNQDDGNRSDTERIQSIKEHFDALTAMTPSDLNEETPQPDPKEEEEEEDDEEPIQALEEFDPDPGLVKNLREKGSRKRKNGAGHDQPPPSKKADFTQADFSQYSRGKKTQNPDEFDPLKKLQNKKSKGGQNRGKQRYKTGGKSAHFKRK